MNSNSPCYGGEGPNPAQKSSRNPNFSPNSIGGCSIGLDRRVQIGSMRPPMETLQDLMEEAKVRLLWWAICVFGISYFLSHTSKSMLTNVPIAVIILCALRYLSYEVELHWKVQPIHRQSYLSHLQKNQISKNDPRLTTLPPTPKWKRQIASPLVESAIHSFIDKILQDFVVDLWYSSITPDKEAAQLIRVLVLDVIGEIAGRIKEINLVDLLTSDMVDMINSHLDLYRKNQSIIGVEVMGTLSREERDERLKHHLMTSGELHPALISPECEYKVLQRLVAGILASVLEPKEAQCPLVRCLGRELLTCLVLQPVMNLASPAYINELIEFLFLASKDDKNKETDRGDENTTTHGHSSHMLNTQSTASDMNKSRVSTQSSGLMLNRTAGETSVSIQSDVASEHPEKPLHTKPAEWAKLLEAATERRTQVLAPDNLENMWTKGRNYRKKAAKLTKSAVPPTGNLNMNSEIVDNYVHAGSGKEMSSNLYHKTTALDDKYQFPLTGLHSSTHKMQNNSVNVSHDLGRTRPVEGTHSVHGQGDQGSQLVERSKYHVTRSSSTSDLKRELNIDAAFPEKAREITNVKEPYLPSFAQEKDGSSLSRASQPVFLSEGSSHTPKLKCRVLGAYFEKSGSNSFAVYSISVTDAENMTWFVKRRYRNFERLHRQLKDIPNYTLHLPPKRFLSSSLDDSFVLRRCILLDKYLQDLLSIANIAEQHEVWDFFSASSKNYSFGKSTSVMKTLAVNVDDAMDDIVRQFKGVSDGLRHKVVGPSLSSHAAYLPNTEQSTSLSYAEGTTNKMSLSHNMEIANSFSDDDIRDEKSSSALITGWHSDNELNLKGFPSRMVRKNGGPRSLGSQSGELSDKFESSDLHQYLASSDLATSSLSEQQNGIPPEWSPPNVSIPLLNLVDNIFQLKRRGWLRRQVFWISKQILQLIMEDAIDDWLLRQICCLRKDDVVAHGIQWVQDVLWPGGTFFTKLEANQMKENDADDGQKMARNSSRRFIDKAPVSFEQQLEAARRASDVKKIVLDGAPTALVSLIGRKQYRCCAKDICYFLQSDICIKQLAYAMLELLLISIFPELHDLVLDIHHADHSQPS